MKTGMTDEGVGKGWWRAYIGCEVIEERLHSLVGV